MPGLGCSPPQGGRGALLAAPFGRGVGGGGWDKSGGALLGPLLGACRFGGGGAGASRGMVSVGWRCCLVGLPPCVGRCSVLGVL